MWAICTCVVSQWTEPADWCKDWADLPRWGLQSKWDCAVRRVRLQDRRGQHPEWLRNFLWRKWVQAGAGRNGKQLGTLRYHSICRHSLGQVSNFPAFFSKKSILIFRLDSVDWKSWFGLSLLVQCLVSWEPSPPITRHSLLWVFISFSRLP